MCDDLSTAAIPAVAFVVQDGEYFYIHTDEAGEDYVAFRACPLTVEFCDMEAAAKARQWLVDSAPHATLTFI